MTQAPIFRTKLAETDLELRAAQRLRYQVFVAELGASGDMADHENLLETDAYDPYFDHLLLIDDTRLHDNWGVVGVYRLLPQTQADKIGQFYSEGEYDLTHLRKSGRKLLELGRSCLHPDYRGGAGMFVLWQALSDYVLHNEIEILFGTASFHGTNIDELAPSLTLLHERHLAPPELRVRAIGNTAQAMNLIDPNELDRKAAMLRVPALIKAYLRLGGTVGLDAYIDYEFNTTDVCLILDTHQMNAKQKQIYVRK